MSRYMDGKWTLYRQLSARGRALLALKSLRGEIEEDSRWRRTMPSKQAAEFNEYVALLNVANIHFVGLICAQAVAVESHWLSYGWLESMREAQAGLNELRLQAGAKKAKDILDLQVMAKALAAAVAKTAADLQAIDAMLKEIGAEFDGEDPLKPATREAFAGAMASIDHLGRLLAIRLPTKPDRERVETLRRFVQEGYKVFVK